jgi:2-dehydro-3-deoxygluconokinase
MAENQFDITSLGEMMLRLSVPSGTRLETATRFDVNPAGAESNVVSLLARLGRRSAWLGGLPVNPLGQLAANQLRLCNVTLDGIVWNETGRMGTYFVELAVSPLPIQVFYDRENSCAAQLTPEQVRWDLLLNTRLLHLTGITPALSTSCREVTKQILARAHAASVPVSFDINYRQKLWSPNEAKLILTEFIQGIEILFCSQADAKRIFGISGTPEQVVQQLADLSRAKHVVVTLGEAGAIALFELKLRRESIPPTQIIDRLGAGDALAAGVIHGWLDGNLELGLRQGMVLAAMALSQHGDMLVTSSKELASLLNNGNNQVSR